MLLLLLAQAAEVPDWRNWIVGIVATAIVTGFSAVVGLLWRINGTLSKLVVVSNGHERRISSLETFRDGFITKIKP